MRLVDYLSLALRDLRRQFLRSSLTILALLISTIILVLMVAISIGGKQAIADQFGTDASLSMITVTPNQSSNTLSPFGNVQEVNMNATVLNDTVVNQLAALPSVRSASPRAHVWELHSFSLVGNAKQFVAQVDGITPTTYVPLKAGNGFTSNDSKGVILGYAYATALGYGDDPHGLVGKTIEFTTQKGYRGAGAVLPSSTATPQETDAFNQSQTHIQATITGVTDSGSDQNNLLISLGWAHDMRTARYNEGGTLKLVDQIAHDGYTTIQVQAANSTSVKSVAASISKLGYGQVSTLSQIERLQQFSTTMWIILGAVAIIAIIAAILGVVNTMLMAVSEQQYVIGVWRACGARKSFIVTLFLVEAALLGVAGGLCGVGLGMFASGFVNQYVNTLLTSQGLALANIAVVPVWLGVGAIALTCVLCIIAGLYPAYRATRQDPSRILSSGQ